MEITIESEKICTECKKKPISVQKRKLCRTCYQRFWRFNKDNRTDEFPTQFYKPKFPTELEFTRNYFRHNNWYYHPAIFRLGEFRYEPDFYDNEKNVFIEVVGTKQAYSQNYEKYLEFVKQFPHLKFEIRNVNGELLDINAQGLKIKI